MKIKELYIKSFRGIPNECVLEFVDRNDKPISSIIYGGNGSGKSSIIDAIEYCLQGKIERSNEIKNKNRPSVINYSNRNYINPTVKIIFDDDSEIQRDIIIVEEEDMSSKYLKNVLILSHFFLLKPIYNQEYLHILLYFLSLRLFVLYQGYILQHYQDKL